MHRVTACVILFFIFFVGCPSQNIDKQQYYEKGRNDLKEGNLNGAIIAFKKAIEQDQSYFEARYQLALTYVLKNKHESAERELLKVMRLNPSLNDAHLVLAKVYLHMEREDSALEEMTIYLRISGNNPEAYDVAASVYAAKKDYTKAEDAVNMSLKISPERLSSKILLAEICLESGKTARAEAIVNEILDLDGRNNSALYLRKKIKEKQNNERSKEEAVVNKKNK